MADLIDDVGNGSEDTIVSNEPLSIRDSLKASMTPDAADAGKTAASEAAAAKARDEAGRFAKVDPAAKPETVAKPDAAAKVAAPVVADPAAPVVAAVPEVVAPVAAPTVKPPSSWSPEAKTAFETLPEHVQAAVAKREQEIERGFSVLQDYKGLEQFSPLIKQAGTTHAQVMQKAIEWEKGLDADPLNTIASVAKIVQQKTGLDLDKILNPALVAHLNQQPQQQRQQPVQQQQPIDVESTVEQILRKRDTENQIQSFLSDPANPHAEAVLDDMVALISTGRAASIKDAYDAACWMRPDIRQQLISQAAPAPQQAVVDPQIAINAQKAAAADQARKAARSVTGTSAPGPSKDARSAVPSSIRDSLREAITSAGGRV